MSGDWLSPASRKKALRSLMVSVEFWVECVAMIPDCGSN